MENLIQLLFSVAAALVAATVAAFAAVYIDRRQASREHARSANPSYFHEVYQKTVILRDAISDLGTVYNKFSDSHHQIIIDLTKIVIARIEDFNRALSPSTNPKVFLLPTKIEKQCSEVRFHLNDAVFKTKFGHDVRLFSIFMRDPLDLPGQIQITEIEKFPKKDPKNNFRCFESRRDSTVLNSDFLNSSFRGDILDRLNKIIVQIKSLCVD